MWIWLLGLLRPFLGRLILYGSLLAMAGGAFLWLKTHYYNEGWNAAINEIAAEDKEAIDAAAKQRQKVKDCYDSGGQWNTVSGVCNRSPADKRAGRVWFFSPSGLSNQG